MSQRNIYVPPVAVPKPKQTAMEVDVEVRSEEFDPQNPYRQIVLSQNDKDEDICCDCCLEYEYEDDDMLVLCELCKVATHQSCHGGDIVNEVPAGPWYCERCKVLLKD